MTDELLTLGENVTQLLDYEEDPEVIAAVANLPKVDDIEMRDIKAPLGFNPEVGCFGYNPNLVRPRDEEAQGSNSPMTEWEDQMLDKDNQSRAPESRRPGSDRNAG